MPNDPNRRRFQTAAAAASALGSRATLAAAARTKEPSLAGENIYTRIGIRPVINAIGVVAVRLCLLR